MTPQITDLSKVQPVATSSIPPTPTKTAPPTWTFLPTATPSLTAFPSWTPLPTLSKPQVEKQLLQWLQGSPDCLLPCLGGIMPGLTTWSEALQILSPRGEIVGVNENVSCTLGICNDLEWDPGGFYEHNSMQLHGVFVSESNRIIYMYIEGYPPNPVLRVDRILSTYGVPAKVFVEVAPSMYGYPYFAITLAYPNHKFIIHFFWNGVWGNGFTSIKGCIQQNLVTLIIDSRDQEWTDDFIRNEVYYSAPRTAEDFMPLEEATGVTIDEFYQTFRAVKGNECISVKIKPH